MNLFSPLYDDLRSISNHTPFTEHARTRIKERYGMEFTSMQWFYFGRVLRDHKVMIRLSDTKERCHFRACYFMGHWYLLVCTREGIVKTAYPRRDLKDYDKLTLKKDLRYRQINNDEFRVWRYF